MKKCSWPREPLTSNPAPTYRGAPFCVRILPLAICFSGVVVGKFLEQQSLVPEVLKRRRLKEFNIIELGAGTGFTGIVAGALGSRFVACTDMECVTSAVTDANVRRNASLYSSKTGGSRVFSRNLPWGSANLSHVDEVLSLMKEKTKSDFVDLVIAVDIAYQRPGLEPHFDKFMETLMYIIEKSSSSSSNQKVDGGRGRKKKKKKDARSNESISVSDEPENKETIFLYGHRRRMSVSEDLLCLIYQHFEDIAPPTHAHSVDPRNFGASEKHGISVMLLRRKRKTAEEEREEEDEATLK